MNDDDRVFKALADPTRRFLLDQLFARDGRTLTELEPELGVSRFAVLQHLRILGEAALRRHEVRADPERGGRRGRSRLRPGEAALPEPGADPADPRPVDRQV